MTTHAQAAQIQEDPDRLSYAHSVTLWKGLLQPGAIPFHRGIVMRNLCLFLAALFFSLKTLPTLHAPELMFMSLFIVTAPLPSDIVYSWLRIFLLNQRISEISADLIPHCSW